MPGILQKKYELTNSKLDTLEFSLDINNISIVFKILFLNNSVYIYISDQNNQTLTDLSLVLPNADGVSTRILGTGNENISVTLGRKVTQLIKKPVYISVNLNHNLYLIEKEVELKLFEEIRNHREKFISPE